MTSVISRIPRIPGQPGKPNYAYGAPQHNLPRDQEVPIRQLKPGERFRLDLPIANKMHFGTLVRIGPGTAMVIMDGHEQERHFNTKEGSVSFVRTTGGPTYWSTSTPVVPVGETRDVTRFLSAPEAAVTKPQAPPKGEAQMTAQAVGLPGIGKHTKTAAQTAKANAAERKAKAKTAPRVKKEVVLNDCLCGCGTQVKGRFSMGHDARYYGWLRAIVNGDEKKLANVPPKFKMGHPKAKAAAELKASGH
jgi:hypothetical protein